jgi:hypothetical protein
VFVKPPPINDSQVVTELQQPPPINESVPEAPILLTEPVTIALLNPLVVLLNPA